MPRRSSNSAGAIYLDKAGRIEELRQAVRRAAGRLPALRRAVLYGSLVSGIPTPRSDADLLLVVGSSDHPEPRDRIPEALLALSPLPCPVDVFVLTSEEFARHRADDSSPLLRTILSSGIDLL